jgi:hypothetical protein
VYGRTAPLVRTVLTHWQWHILRLVHSFTYSCIEYYIITMLQVGWPKNSGSAPSKSNILCHVYSIHTGSGELSASYSAGTGISFLRCKTRSVCEADNLPPYHVEVKEMWSYPFNPNMPPRCVQGQLHAHLYVLNKGKVFPITCHEGREEE